MSVRITFLWRDLWIGAYIGTARYGIGPRGQFRERSLWVCIVPMFPIVFTRTVYR